MIVRCNECNSTNVMKAGTEWRKRVRNIQRYRCKDCGKLFGVEKESRENKKEETNGGIK